MRQLSVPCGSWHFGHIPSRTGPCRISFSGFDSTHCFMFMIFPVGVSSGWLWQPKHTFIGGHSLRRFS